MFSLVAPVPLGGGYVLSAGRAPVSSGPLPPTPWLLLMYLEVVTLSPPPGLSVSSEGGIGEMGIVCSLLSTWGRGCGPIDPRGLMDGAPSTAITGSPTTMGVSVLSGPNFYIYTHTHTHTHTHTMITSYIKLNSRWLRYLNLKNETLHVPEKTRKTEDTLEFGRPF